MPQSRGLCRFCLDGVALTKLPCAGPFLLKEQLGWSPMMSGEAAVATCYFYSLCAVLCSSVRLPQPCTVIPLPATTTYLYRQHNTVSRQPLTRQSLELAPCCRYKVPAGASSPLPTSSPVNQPACSVSPCNWWTCGRALLQGLTGAPHNWPQQSLPQASSTPLTPLRHLPRRPP